MKLLLVPLSLAGLLAGALVASSTAGVAPQRDFSVRSEPVAGNVHVLFGQGGNVGASVGEDGVLLIDDQFADSEPHLRSALEALGHERVTYLVNTHWHPDHTGSNSAFGQEAVVVAHANVRARLAGADGVEGRKSEPPSPVAALPVVTHEHGLSLHFNGEEVRLLTYGRGHTDGDTVVWFTESKVVHMGDLYFQVAYPFLDLNSGGGALGLLEALDGVLAVIPEDTRVISGHGEVTDVAALGAYREMVATLLGRVREARELGETPEQMVANGLTKDFDERWAKEGWFVSPLAFVTALDASLERQR